MARFLMFLYLANINLILSSDISPASEHVDEKFSLGSRDYINTHAKGGVSSTSFENNLIGSYLGRLLAIL